MSGQRDLHTLTYISEPKIYPFYSGFYHKVQIPQPLPEIFFDGQRCDYYEIISLRDGKLRSNSLHSLFIALLDLWWGSQGLTIKTKQKIKMHTYPNYKVIWVYLL